jgi:hypothetical protein
MKFSWRFALIAVAGTITIAIAQDRRLVAAAATPDLPLRTRFLPPIDQNKQPTLIHNLLTMVWRHGFPMKDALRLTPGKELFELAKLHLDEKSKPANVINAMYLLSISADPRVSDTLVCLLETGGISLEREPQDSTERNPNPRCAGQSPSNPLVSSQTFEVRSTVPRALGVLIYQLGRIESRGELNEGQRAERIRAREYLGACASPSPKSWGKRISWRTARFQSGNAELDEARLFAGLTEECLEGLALSGDPEALKKLDLIGSHLEAKATQTRFGEDHEAVRDSGYAAVLVNRDFFEDFDLKVRRAKIRNCAVSQLGLDEMF